jgi:2-methylcitrate dehydratase PrpD
MDSTKSLTEIVTWLFSVDPMGQPDVNERARLLFVDTLGCMIAGLVKPAPKSIVDAISRLDGGSVQLPGATAALSTTGAAYASGLAACWDEACEGLGRAHGRPGLHAFAAVLPLALARGHDLGEMLSALVAGYEIAGRLGEVLRIPPEMHVDGTWGTFGAATAAARLLRLTPDATVSALQGAACHLPWSLYLPITHGADIRNAYVGDAAIRGIMAAIAAEAGISTPPGAIETYDKLALGGEPTGKTLAPAGEWLIPQGYLKPFAAVRHVHFGAQAAIEWRRLHGDRGTSEIRSLDLSIYREAMTYCGNRAPRAPIQAQFSLSHGLAWALVHGDLTPEAYDDAGLTNPEVRRLEELVRISEDRAMTAENRRAARLVVATPSGDQCTVSGVVPGEPDMPLSAKDVEAKFIRYAAPGIGAGRAKDMASALLNAPLTASVAEIFGERGGSRS